MRIHAALQNTEVYHNHFKSHHLILYWATW